MFNKKSVYINTNKHNDSFVKLIRLKNMSIHPLLVDLTFIFFTHGYFQTLQERVLVSTKHPSIQLDSERL